MKKFKFLLLVLGMFCTLSTYAQEEFFANNTGLSVSETADFSYSYETELSLHLKNGLVFSGSRATVEDLSITSIGLGYITHNKYNENGTNGIIGLSYGFLPEDYKLLGIGMGLNKLFFLQSNFPFSFTGSVSFSSLFHDGESDDSNLGLSIGYTQSFFTNNPIYPVAGVTYSFPINKTYSSDEKKGIFLFHVGLNIKLL